jgi:hypothetical protein
VLWVAPGSPPCISQKNVLRGVVNVPHFPAHMMSGAVLGGRSHGRSRSRSSSRGRAGADPTKLASLRASLTFTDLKTVGKALNTDGRPATAVVATKVGSAAQKRVPTALAAVLAKPCNRGALAELTSAVGTAFDSWNTKLLVPVVPPKRLACAKADAAAKKAAEEAKRKDAADPYSVSRIKDLLSVPLYANAGQLQVFVPFSKESDAMVNGLNGAGVSVSKGLDVRPRVILPPKPKCFLPAGSRRSGGRSRSRSSSRSRSGSRSSSRSRSASRSRPPKSSSGAYKPGSYAPSGSRTKTVKPTWAAGSEVILGDAAFIAALRQEGQCIATPGGLTYEQQVSVAQRRANAAAGRTGTIGLLGLVVHHCMGLPLEHVYDDERVKAVAQLALSSIPKHNAAVTGLKKAATTTAYGLSHYTVGTTASGRTVVERTGGFMRRACSDVKADFLQVVKGVATPSELATLLDPTALPATKGPVLAKVAVKVAQRVETDPKVAADVQQLESSFESAVATTADHAAAARADVQDAKVEVDAARADLAVTQAEAVSASGDPYAGATAPPLEAVVTAERKVEETEQRLDDATQVAAQATAQQSLLSRAMSGAGQLLSQASEVGSRIGQGLVKAAPGIAALGTVLAVGGALLGSQTVTTAGQVLGATAAAANATSTLANTTTPGARVPVEDQLLLRRGPAEGTSTGYTGPQLLIAPPPTVQLIAPPPSAGGRRHRRW